MNFGIAIGVLIVFYGLIIIRRKFALLPPLFIVEIKGLDAVIWGIFIIAIGIIVIFFNL